MELSLSLSSLAISAPIAGIPDLAFLHNFAGMTTGDTITDFTFTRSTAATYWDAEGLLQSAAINAMRISRDPVSGEMGYLAEPQRTNSFLYSQDPSNAAWTKGNAAVTLAQTAGPDGLTSGAKVECSTTTNTTFYQFFTCNSTSVCFYAVVKIGTGATTANKYRIRNDTSAATLLDISLDYSTGGVTVNSGTGTAGSVLLGNGWILVWASTSTGITSGNLVRFYMGFNSSVSTAGDYFHLFHAQAEAGASYPTSYIPTTTATVTRGADLLTHTLSGANATALSTAGTMVCRFSFLGGDNSADANSRITVSVDTDANNRFCLSNRTTGFGGQAVLAGSNIATPVVPGTYATNTPYKAAFGWASNNLRAAVSGSQSSLFSSGAATMPAVLYLTIGALSSGGSVFGGLIHSVSVYTSRLTDATLQALTA